MPDTTRTPTPRAKAAPKVPAKTLQRDLFQLDSPLIGEIRGERSLMAFAIFVLFKNAWMKPLSYEHGPVAIEVRGGLVCLHRLAVLGK